VRRVNAIALIVVFALVVASCSEAAVSSEPSDQAPVETLTPLETPAESFPTEPPFEEPLGSDEPFPTEPPLEEPFPSDEPFPGEEPIPSEPPLITPPPGTSIPAAECSENANEQGFWARVVIEMDWDVYCPGLPAGWHIGDAGGRWRSTGTGFLEIFYEGPSGALLELKEGAFCATSDGCAPAGSDAGAAPFGDLSGTLIAGSDGSWAVVVDPSADVSYLLVGRSIDEATFRDLAAGMSRVEP
jgi:hypothetical protein